MSWVAEVDYKGGVDRIMDDGLAGLAKKYGGKPAGGGYDFQIDRRDIAWSFGKLEKAERFLDIVRRIGKWSSRTRKRIFHEYDFKGAIRSKYARKFRREKK